MVVTAGLPLFLLWTAALCALPVQSSNDEAVPVVGANSYLQAGNDAYGAGDLPQAAAAYEACLAQSYTSDNNDLSSSVRNYCAINLASVIVDMEDGDLGRAEELYRMALKADPSDGDAAFNLALLLQDRKTQATTRECADLYQIAVTADPSRWDAWANLATALVELSEQPLYAIHAFERAILLIEQIMAEQGQAGEDPARDVYLSKLYYGYGMTLSELSPEACQILAAAPNTLLIGSNSNRNRNKNDQTTTTNAIICLENAQNALRSAAILDATNVQAAHMLAAMGEGGGGDGVHRRATPEFVAALFDDFADTFDEKLGALEYKVPRIMGDAARRARQVAFRSALDAGCGTGLAGRYLRPLVSGPMIGVDISKKMLDIAARCTTVSGCGVEDNDTAVDDGKEEEAPPLYDGLMALDLEAMTLSETLHAPGVGRATDIGSEEGFDLIVAADVHVYFGRLDTLLQNYAKLSRDEAVLLFSCERATEEEAPLGWRLLSSGRFSHTKKYVVQAAEDVGYELASYEEIVPRMERGVAVNGHLFHFVLKNRDSAVERDEL